MVFLLCNIFSLWSAITFLYVWKVMPVSWLFDCSGLSPEETASPHPKASTLAFLPHGFLLFFLFLALALTLSEKVALIGVFWGFSLFWFLTQIALSDLYYRSIPDQWSFGIAILGLFRLSAEISSLLLCIVIALLLHCLPKHLLGFPALGLGDVKLFFALAIALTGREFLTLMTSAALLGGAVAAGMILYRHFVPASSDRGVPYGTVVAVAALLQLLFL
ncbi:MAG: prepilin peptidase [Firmicutes bacterium]|nr:prepilin peptidase [Bacillota bacterium]